MAGIKYFILYSLVLSGTTLILAEITKALDLGKDLKTSFKLGLPFPQFHFLFVR